MSTLLEHLKMLRDNRELIHDTRQTGLVWTLLHWHLDELISLVERAAPQGPTLSGIQDASDTVATAGSALPKGGNECEGGEPK